MDVIEYNYYKVKLEKSEHILQKDNPTPHNPLPLSQEQDLLVQ